VGPDLSVFATKPFEEFLAAVVDPNAAVDPRHAGQSVETTDGLEWTGVVAEASDQALTLLLPGGHRERIPRDSIRRQTPLGRSLMPEGLTDGWTPQQIADLFAWIRNP
jgi:putative heme-binding domain-containing protein